RAAATRPTACPARSLHDALPIFEHAVALAIPDSAKDFALFTDASDLFWSAMLVQYDPAEKEKPPDQRNMQPLAFLSGQFVGSKADRKSTRLNSRHVKSSYAVVCL